jgi:hypothetical protein
MSERPTHSLSLVTDLKKHLAAVQSAKSEQELFIAWSEWMTASTDHTAQIRQQRQDSALRLHATGLSWANIGELVGLSRGRAHQIANGYTGGRRGNTRADDSA